MLILLLANRRNRRRLKLLLTGAAAGVALLLLTPMLMLFGQVTDAGDASAAACAGADGTPASTPTGGSGLNGERLANATVIVQTGQQLRVPARGWVIAVATAKQESDLINTRTPDDHDSLGLFQQRPSQGWGTAQQVTDPVYSSTQFYRHLMHIAGWQGMPLTVAAQAVQRSAYPNAYAKWEPLAKATVTAISQQSRGLDAAADEGQTACALVEPSAAPTLPAGPVGLMIAAALSRIGDPYVWGAVGPTAFDCSGLVVWSWRQAGYSLPVRTAAEMWHQSDPVPAGQEQPGDLIFSNFGARAGLGPDDPGHVQIVVRPGTLVEAYDVGIPVRSVNYRHKAGQRFGRFKPGVLHPVGG